MDWPIREIFLGYLAILKREAREQYHHDLLVWAVLAPHAKRGSLKQPSVPTILK